MWGPSKHTYVGMLSNLRVRGLGDFAPFCALRVGTSASAILGLTFRPGFRTVGPSTMRTDPFFEVSDPKLKVSDPKLKWDPKLEKEADFKLWD